MARTQDTYGARHQGTIDWRSLVYKGRSPESDFFSSNEWKRLRSLSLRRDNHTCQRCGEEPLGVRIGVHHIIPRADGGADVLENLISLCPRCHDIVEDDGTLITRSLIINSYEDEVKEIRREREKQDKEIDDGRPSWHSWVYGGSRPPE